MRKTKEEIIAELGDTFKSLGDLCDNINQQDFNISRQNKWTPAENIQHLVTSTRMTTMAFALPKFVHVMLYGKPGRTSHGYSKVIDNYKKKLEQGAEATGLYIPKKTDYSRDALKGKLDNEAGKLIRALDKKWTDEQLDHYVVKHPILGLLTVRELAYFTIYHNGHHFSTVQQIYLGAPGR